MKIFIFFLLIFIIPISAIPTFSDNELDLLIKTGKTLYENENYQEAITYFDRALEIDPNNIDVLNEKGKSLIILNKSEEAITYFDRALEIDPNNFRTLNNKGSALMTIAKYIEAIHYLDRALEIEPNNTSALNNKGAALYMLDDLEQSAIHFNKTLSLDPENQKALVTLSSMNTEFDLKPIDGMMEVIIRDHHDNLVGYIKTTNISILDHEVASNIIEDWPTKKIVTRNGKNFQLSQLIISYPAPEDNAFSQSGYVLMYEPTIWLFFGHHYQYVAQEGETITNIYTVFKPLE